MPYRITRGGVRSPEAYRWWDQDGGPTGPDPAPILEAAAAGDVDALGPLLFNDLEPPVFARRPDIAVGAAASRDRSRPHHSAATV